MAWNPYSVEAIRKRQERLRKEFMNTEEVSSYKHWTKKELYEKVKNLNIKGRSKMNKKELIAAITKETS